MLFRPLSFFRVLEDGQVRGDDHDGVLIYAPRTGLQITKQDGTSLSLKGWRFTSSAKTDEIFVYCASKQLSRELAERFHSPVCVEITDEERLLRHLKARRHPASRLDYAGLVSGSVEYREHGKKPKADWALPEKLALIKPTDFRWQDEFRVAIGRKGEFDAENVDLRLEKGVLRRTAATALSWGIRLRINSLADFATLHRF